MSLIDQLIPLSIEEYDQMVEHGILKPDDHVELIRGRLVRLPLLSDEHIAQVRKLFKLFDKGADEYNKGKKWGKQIIVRQNAPILLANSKPQPEIAVVVPDKDTEEIGDIDHCYLDRTPSAAETLLVIEVGNTDLRESREEKIRVYAEGGVPEVWILDTDRKDLTVYRNPVGSHYTQCSALSHGNISPHGVPGLIISIEKLLLPSVSQHAAQQRVGSSAEMSRG